MIDSRVQASLDVTFREPVTTPDDVVTLPRLLSEKKCKEDRNSR